MTMFSGIVEAQSKLVQMQNLENTNEKIVRIFVQRPSIFDDIKNGDSIAVNGVCLTIEKFDPEKIQFCLGAETLALLASSLPQWEKYPLNLERSLKMGDRIHGHLVTGHVDHLARVVESYQDGESWQIKIQVPQPILQFLWKKGSVCLNGVSLTINDVAGDLISVCLIPETIARTNLSSIAKDEFVNVEVDYLAKAYFQSKADQ